MSNKVTGYVKPKTKQKLVQLANAWECSESQALTRLIQEKPLPKK